MRLYTGTSGFAYKEWKGSFYPEGARDSELLELYARTLSACEINSTFYRMPRGSVLASWRERVPDDFVFVLKASQRITHRSRLVSCEDSVDYFWKQAQALEDKLGPVLFQLPPNFGPSLERLERFLAVLPPDMRAAFEFRHPGWQDDAVFERLRARDCAWCIADTDDHPGEIVSTASWGYVRLRRPGYSESQLATWKERFEAQSWSEVFCFFKHEDGAVGPRLARELVDL